MNDQLEKESNGWRGSKELWLDAAYKTLLENGIDSVKILTLAKMVKLSRTSFYWFFEDRDALLNALLSRWQEKNTASLVAQTHAYAQSLAEATLNIFDCWLDDTLFDSCFEHAVRCWSVQSPSVANALDDSDRVRLEAIKAMLVRYGCEPLIADIRSRALYLSQIGHISIGKRENIETQLQRLPSYVAIYTGALPTADELARFHQRHSAKTSAAYQPAL